jgi:hypothetical protein
MSFGFDEPMPYLGVPEAERSDRCELTSDLCVIDNQHFFIRGCLEIPVHDAPSPFVWGVWTSLSLTSFKRVVQLWDDPARENELPYFGWLCNSIPVYQSTLHLKTQVHTRSLNQRPFIELEPTNHPLAVDQHEGITMARVQAIVEAFCIRHRPHRNDQPTSSGSGKQL